MEFAQEMEQKVPSGYLFDYVDPSSGVLMNSDNRNATYNEVEGA